MNYISETAIIDRISQKILQPKQSSYNEEPIFYALSYLDNYEYVDSSVYNKYNEKLKVSLFFNRAQSQDKCIVYMHGYGSNRVEGVVLLRYLPPDLSLCCFDFSAEGKSQGRIVTYGQKQKDDIKAVLGYLRTCGYQKFILWGRSMGATCTLLFSIKQKPKDVILQLLDSPFISFTEAALQLTKKRINIPEVLLSIALEALNKNLRNKQYNPFEVDLNCSIYCDIPTIFIYSQNDEVISHQNTFNIIKNFKGYYQKIVISESHNATRKSTTIRDLVNIMKKYLVRAEIKKKQNVKQSPKIIKQIRTSTKQLKKHMSMDSYGVDMCPQQVDPNEVNRALYGSQIMGKRPKSSIKVFSSFQNVEQKSMSQQKVKVIPKFNRMSNSKQKITLHHRLSNNLYL